MDKLNYGQFDPARSESPFNDSSYTDPANEVESRKQLGYPFLEVQEYINDKLVPEVENNTDNIEKVRTDSINTYATKSVVNALNERVARVEEKSGLADVSLVAGANVTIDDLGKTDNVRSFMISSIGGGGGGGGVTDYTQLTSKPSINGVTLSGNKTADNLGLVAKVTGKGLSTNDYTTTEKTKLASLSNYNDTSIRQSIAGVEARVTTVEETIANNPHKIFTNININANPSPLGSYMPWDTSALYGYYFDVTVANITNNTLIENIIMTDTLLANVGYIVTTMTNKLRFYTQTNDSVSGTIITLITSEVWYG